MSSIARPRLRDECDDVALSGEDSEISLTFEAGVANGIMIVRVQSERSEIHTKRRTRSTRKLYHVRDTTGELNVAELLLPGRKIAEITWISSIRKRTRRTKRSKKVSNSLVKHRPVRQRI